MFHHNNIATGKATFFTYIDTRFSNIFNFFSSNCK